MLAGDVFPLPYRSWNFFFLLANCLPPFTSIKHQPILDLVTIQLYKKRNNMTEIPNTVRYISKVVQNEFIYKHALTGNINVSLTRTSRFRNCCENCTRRNTLQIVPGETIMSCSLNGDYCLNFSTYSKPTSNILNFEREYLGNMAFIVCK